MNRIHRAELIKVFNEESHSIIDKMREDLAALNKDMRDKNNDVRTKDLFRYAHTLWGSSGTVGFQEIERIAGALQEILMDLNGASVKLTPDIILLVTEGVEACETLLEQKEVINYQELMGRLRKAAEGKPKKSVGAVSTTTKESVGTQLPKERGKSSKNAHLTEREGISEVSMLIAATAHELNNPMMGIINLVQYCLKHTPEDDKRHAVLQDTEQETKRCIAIVKRLLAFSLLLTAGQEGRKKESCTAIMNKVLKSLSYNIEREKVSVTHDYSEGLPAVWMTPSKIEQTFLNIIGNALDALKESEKKQIDVKVRRKGEFIQVRISDSGTGIDPQNLERIFQPFFSTKPAGQGVGLGLCVSLTNIEKHGGKITCESKTGQGTKFEILLPLDRRKTRREQNEKERSGN